LKWRGERHRFLLSKNWTSVQLVTGGKAAKSAAHGKNPLSGGAVWKFSPVPASNSRRGAVLAAGSTAAELKAVAASFLLAFA
jgi:hypothetical protein